MDTDIKLVNGTPKTKIELRLTIRDIISLATCLRQIEDVPFNEDELVSGVLRACTREIIKQLDEKAFKISQSDSFSKTNKHKIKFKAQYTCTLLYVLMYVVLDWTRFDEYTKTVLRTVTSEIMKTL